MDNRQIKGSSGIILLEVCAAIIIVGLLLSSWLAVNQIRIKRQRIEDTYEAMNVVQMSLQAFYRTYNRYPCPASVVPDSEGRLDYKETVCDNLVVQPLGVKTVPGFEDKMVSIGVIPTRTLGLSERFSADGWGTRITYAVSHDLTDQTRPSGAEQYKEAAIALVDRKGELIIDPPPVYILVSHGSNGAGSWGIDGFDKSCVTGTYEEENCDMDGVFRLEAHAEGQGAQYFDDMVLHDRDILYSGNEEIAKETLTKLLSCQRKGAFYDPDDIGADENGCVGRTLTSGSCANGLVMAGIDAAGQIVCIPNMQPSLCRGGEMLLGYDENGSIVCSDVVLKMLSCAQTGMIYAGVGTSGADGNGCIHAVSSLAP